MLRRVEQEPNREQMLTYIEKSPFKILSIQGEGPGTGQKPDLSQGDNELVESAYRLFYELESIRQGNSYWFILNQR